MRRQMPFRVLAWCSVCFMAMGAGQAEPTKPPAKESVSFDGEEFFLAFQSATATEVLKEYIPKDQGLETWTKFAALHEYLTIDDPEVMAGNMVRLLKAQNPPRPSDVIKNPQTGEVILDFVTWSTEPQMVEFNIFRFKKKPGGGLLAQQYALREYKDPKAFLQALPPVRKRLVNLMAESGLTLGPPIGAAAPSGPTAVAMSVSKLSVDGPDQQDAAQKLGDLYMAGNVNLTAEQAATVHRFVESQLSIIAKANPEDGAARQEANKQIQRLWRLAAPALIDGLRNESPAAVEAAVKNLSLMRSESIVKDLIAQVQKSSEPKFRLGLVFALSTMREKRKAQMPGREQINDTESKRLADELIAPCYQKLAAEDKDAAVKKAAGEGLRRLGVTPPG